MKAPPQSEAAWQRTVLDLARLLGWWVYHTHDSRRSTAGFPDLVLIRDRVIFAELKTSSGKVRDAQKLWIGLLERAGGEVYLWRPDDFDEVHEILRRRDAG